MYEGERDDRNPGNPEGSRGDFAAEQRGRASSARPDPANLIWLVPLVIVVLVLVWYIFTRGEPRSPFGRSEPEAPAPAVETEPVEPPVIQVPEIVPEPPPAAEPPAATPSVERADPEPAPAEPEPAPAGEDPPP